MSASTNPRAPFADWAVQKYDPRFGFAWYTQPGALLTQLTIEHGTVESVHALHDVIDEALEVNSVELADYGGLLLIHDMRSLRGHDPAARIAWIGRMKRRKGHWGRAAVIAVSGSPILRMAANTIAMMVVLGSGGRFDNSVVADPAEALRKYRVEPPRS